jgi:molybdate transport system substrate-binding protein
MRRLWLVFAALFLLTAPARAEDRPIVFAAASLKTSLDAAVAAWRGGGGGAVDVSYGGSLALARQILADAG